MDLNKIANKVRYECFKALVNAGGGHFGGSLSEIEILTTLYFDEMNIDPQKPTMPERDRFILSKGHGGPGLYTTLAVRGYYGLERLNEIDRNGSHMPKHVNRLKLEGIDVSSGSLGQGLSVGNGMAIAAKLAGTTHRVYVLMGDGEQNEGQVWEACMTSAKYKLDNVCAVIDRNKNQVDGRSDDVKPLLDLKSKYQSFGWNVLEADGHDCYSLKKAFAAAKECKGKPSVIIADTIKGKGVSFMEDNYVWHSGSVTEEQAEIGFKELEALI